ncbi:hypothetical protein [Asaia bogorensis]|uniref:hypothetical protein n=1 Tax=Asaia bogorensis TaxID=91915 RepID=UPI0013CE64D9|nr:hypothetical protein [Asaia bogorensis]
MRVRTTLLAGLIAISVTIPVDHAGAGTQPVVNMKGASQEGAPPPASGSLPTGCVFDLTSLPRFSGRVERLLPGTQGDVVGALLVDGTEIEMPPGLAAQDHHLRKGAMISVRGLAAPSLHLVRAFALSNGTDICAAPMPELVTAAPPASTQGRISRLLHDGDGALNGALLDDGSVLRVPASGARTSFLRLGAPIYAEGYGYQTAYGKLVVARRLGPDRLQAIHVSDEPLIPRGAPPGSLGYDQIETPGGTE